jgi:Fe-S cluster biogenesis protein NfuA
MSDSEAAGLRRQMQRIDELLQTLEQLADPTAHAAARELFQTVLAFHRSGLHRLLEIIRRHDGAAALTADCGRDDLISGVLLLHGLHPVDLLTRVRQGVEQVRPLLRCHGGDLELISIVGGRIRLRLLGPCSLSVEALEHALEETFTTLAPDAEVIQVEENTSVVDHSTSLLSLPMVV